MVGIDRTLCGGEYYKMRCSWMRGLMVLVVDEG